MECHRTICSDSNCENAGEAVWIILQGQDDLYESCKARRSLKMSDIRFDGPQNARLPSRSTGAENRSQCFYFDGIA